MYGKKRKKDFHKLFLNEMVPGKKKRSEKAHEGGKVDG